MACLMPLGLLPRLPIALNSPPACASQSRSCRMAPRYDVRERRGGAFPRGRLSCSGGTIQGRASAVSFGGLAARTSWQRGDAWLPSVFLGRRTASVLITPYNTTDRAPQGHSIIEQWNVLICSDGSPFLENLARLKIHFSLVNGRGLGYLRTSKSTDYRVRVPSVPPALSSESTSYERRGSCSEMF
jgi:hypothetical protein